MDFGLPFWFFLWPSRKWGPVSEEEKAKNQKPVDRANADLLHRPEPTPSARSGPVRAHELFALTSVYIKTTTSPILNPGIRIFLGNLQTPGENGSGLRKERWLKRMEKEPTPRTLRTWTNIWLVLLVATKSTKRSASNERQPCSDRDTLSFRDFYPKSWRLLPEFGETRADPNVAPDAAEDHFGRSKPHGKNPPWP